VVLVKLSTWRNCVLTIALDLAHPETR